MQKRDQSGEQGMVVVETVLTFTVFLVLVFSIIYFINILILHNKVQYAINSAAHELASYTYLYAAFNLRDAEQTVNEDGHEYTQPIDEAAGSAHKSYEKVVKAYGSAENAAGETMKVLNGLQNFGSSEAVGEGENSDSGFNTGGIDIETLAQQFADLKDQTSSAKDAWTQAGEDIHSAVDQGKETMNQVKNLFQDKEGLITGLAFMGLQAAEYGVKDLLGTGAAYLLTRGYLRQGSMDADAFMRAYGVKDGYDGLDFSGSTLFCDVDNDSDSRDDFHMIDIVVEYDVEVGFMQLIMPGAKIHMVNRVTLPAWLDGDGVKVEPGE